MNITRKLTVTGLVVLLIIGATVPGLAQNAGPDEARRVESLSAREMFEEVNRFARDRFSEIEGAGIAVSDELRNETAENQRRLADRYLTLAKSRDGNSGDDLYYIGMLGWISQDFENATAFLARYIDSDSDNRERKQVSRSVMVVMLARTGQFERAGKLLEGYLEGGPEKPRERLRMESEMSIAKKRAGDIRGALSHSRNAFSAAVALAGDPRNSAVAIVEIINMGMESHELCLALRDDACSTKALGDLRDASLKFESPVAFFISTNELIRHHAEKGRRDEATSLFKRSISDDLKSFSSSSAADDVASRLKLNERQYLLIGEEPPDLGDIASVFPNGFENLKSLKGKVVLLDFWATWCLPCFEAFPKLRQWSDRFRDDLEVIGLTRLYRNIDGEEVDEKSEISYLRRFRDEQSLDYRIIVSRDVEAEFTYGVRALPTVVLIDRSGKVRYIDSGSSPARLEKLRLKLEELVSEK
jgi:thiol-disulfide isomerase/thioredoxin